MKLKDYFKVVKFFGSYAAVILVVKNKLVDVVVMNDIDLDCMIEVG